MTVREMSCLTCQDFKKRVKFYAKIFHILALIALCWYVISILTEEWCVSADNVYITCDSCTFLRNENTWWFWALARAYCKLSERFRKRTMHGNATFRYLESIIAVKVVIYIETWISQTLKSIYILLPRVCEAIERVLKWIYIFNLQWITFYHIVLRREFWLR